MFAPGFITSSYQQGVGMLTNKNLPWYERAIGGIASTAMAPMMLVEETGRAVMNVPYYGSQIGQNAAQISLASNDEDAIVAALKLTSNAAAGFMGASALVPGSVSMNAPMTIEQRALAQFPGSAAIDAARSTYTRPLGFESGPQFQSFGSSFYSGFETAGYPNVQAAFQGSSVTGRSFREGVAFDVGRVSDYDIAISSPELFSKAQEIGISLRQQGSRTQPLSLDKTPHLIEQMGLTALTTQLSTQAGRPVNFMIYRSIEDAMTRSPSLPVPRPQ